MRQSIKILILCSAAAAFAVIAPASANTSTVTKEVVFSDLNLSNPAGLETLSRRIEAATQQVCERNWDRSERRAANYADKQRCIADVRRQISEQVAQKRELASAADVYATPLTSDISE